MYFKHNPHIFLNNFFLTKIYVKYVSIQNIYTFTINEICSRYTTANKQFISHAILVNTIFFLTNVLIYLLDPNVKCNVMIIIQI